MFDDQGDYQCYANSTDSFNSTSSVIKLRVKGIHVLSGYIL
jgi:hypothetical protein